MAILRNALNNPYRYLTMLAVVVLFAVAACGGSDPTSVPTAVPTTAASSSGGGTDGGTGGGSGGGTGGGTGGGSGSSGGVIKVGVLHSLSGTMAISETAVRDATLLAIEEINAAGGVLGKQLEPIVEDGASDWPTFAEKARKLIQSDEVDVVFGGWTSASRKAMLPVFEGLNSLLFYPVQYEGLETSPNIFYTGATTNQQIVPAVESLLEDGKTRFFLLGSDYVFPRTSNLIINAQLEAAGLEAVGEEYTPLGHVEYSTVINKIQAANPDVVFNTLNGDSNVAFFKQLKDAGIGAADLPTLSVSVAEEEIRGIGAENIEGHLVAWNYFQTTDTPENEKFVAAYKARYGADRVTDDPIEAGYFGVYLWAAAAEKAGSTDVAAVKAAAGGISFQAPGGLVTINGDNQHVSKTVRVGVVRSDGQIEETWNSGGPVDPDPYLETYDWATQFHREGSAITTPGDSSGGVIKIGVLHSLSGTMAISETAVRDATLLAIEEINAAGGVLGRQLEPIVEDGASDWPTFAEKARKLIQSDEVDVVFGGWTSASRKAMLPVFEGLNGLLFYPVQYEGLETSPNIFYTGATTNQQIVPAVESLLEDGKTRFFLLGSDYVFPRTSNLIINAQLEAAGLEAVGEEYTPLGHVEYSTVINKIQAANPDVVFNTLNGDSNVAFFKQLKDAAISAQDLPTLSVSVAEEEIRGIGAENIEGHLVAWNYFQTTDTPENEKFVAAYKAKYGADRVTDDPIEAGYFGVYLWAAAAEKAGSTDVDAVKAAAGGITFQAPGGLITINGDNQHVSKTVRVGVVRGDGQIEETWNSGGPVDPDPYLETYDWASRFHR